MDVKSPCGNRQDPDFVFGDRQNSHFLLYKRSEQRAASELRSMDVLERLREVGKEVRSRIPAGKRTEGYVPGDDSEVAPPPIPSPPRCLKQAGYV